MEEILTELLPFVIPMVLRRRAKEQQTIRLGVTWIKVDGRTALVVPTKYYNLRTEEAFIAYLKKEVRNAIEETLLASNDEEPQTDQADARGL